MSLNEKENPRILVFAGPNGSGKSTVTKKTPLVRTYVNADNIKAMEGCSDLAAAQKAEAIRERLLSHHASFTFETVLSTPRNLNLLKRAKNEGYSIFAVFVLTADSAINVQRVKSRALGGGHDVPEDKIVERYHRSLKNIAPLARIADDLKIIDNSGEYPVCICSKHGNIVEIFPSEQWPKKNIFALLINQENPI